jgi:hypothetical protein
MIIFFGCFICVLIMMLHAPTVEMGALIGFVFGASCATQVACWIAWQRLK